MSDCLFCSIVAGSIPSTRVYEDDTFVAFRDIHPQADVHVLVVPRTHVESINHLEDTHRPLIGEIFFVARDIAAREGVGEGYRLKFNVGRKGGQTVDHLHLHILAEKAGLSERS